RAQCSGRGGPMKRPSRELNIFSISALDLFASAMGAFILIAVILFPYYQQNARILQELKEAKAAHAAAVAERDQAVAERDRLREEARRAQDEARAARERQAEAEARLRQLEKERPQKTPEPQTAGARSAWRYGNLEFVMY